MRGRRKEVKMGDTQLDRILREIDAETEETRMVTGMKWYIVGVPEEMEPRASFVEDLDKLVDESVAEVRA
jgi:hypothetical protein